MTFPNTQFAGLGLIDYVNGATPQEFFKESDATQWDNEIIALTGGLRGGQFRAVFNDTGVLIAKGKPVKISGFDIASGLPEVSLAQADAVGNYADGIALADIGIGGEGVIVKRLVITGLDTSALVVAFLDVYLSAGVAGDLGTIVTQQRVGRVTVIDAVNGQIEFDVERSPLLLPDQSVANDQLAAEVQNRSGHAPADDTSISSVVFQNAPILNIPAGKRWHFRHYMLIGQAAGVADLKIQYDFLDTLTWHKFTIRDYGLNGAAFDPNANNAINLPLNAPVSLDMPAAGNYFVLVEGTFQHGGAVPTNFVFRFSQDTTDAGNPTTYQQGSVLHLQGMT